MPQPQLQGHLWDSHAQYPPRQALSLSSAPTMAPGLETFFGKQSPRLPSPWGQGGSGAHQGRASGQPRFGDTNVLIIFAEFLYN